MRRGAPATGRGCAGARPRPGGSGAGRRARGRDGGDGARGVEAAGGGGWLAVLRGDLAAARRFAGESLALALDLGAGMRLGWAYMVLGHVAATDGDAPRAVRLFAAAA